MLFKTMQLVGSILTFLSVSIMLFNCTTKGDYLKDKVELETKNRSFRSELHLSNTLVAVELTYFKI
jgi:hypothetical protein